MKYWAVFLALLLLLSGSGYGLKDSANPSAATLDEAIETLESESANWRRVLEETRDKLTDSAQSAIRIEVGDALTRAIAATGTEFRCDADCVRMRARQDLIRIRAGLVNQPTPSRRPSKMPWSGWWWASKRFPPPMAADGGPLDKFDWYMTSLGLPNPGSKMWEMNYHYHPGCSWCGHCNGWAAASILEPEPTQPGRVGMIYFTVGDLKGLLAEAHNTDAYDLIEGKRDIVTRTRDDELEATVFHRVLLDWVMNGEPVIMDRVKNPEVRNHPVYKCEMSSQPDQSDPQKIHVIATLWYVSCNVNPNYVGTRAFPVTYQYWVSGDFQNPSGGDWEGKSVYDHPGFIWHPTFVNADPRLTPNPVVRYYDPYILQLLNSIKSGSYIATPDPGSGAIERSDISDVFPHSRINPPIYWGLEPHGSFEGFAGPAMKISQNVPGDELTGAVHARSRESSHGRRLLRVERRMNVKKAGKRYPEWREGTWWQIRVRQRAIAAMEKDVAWTQPFRLFFKVLGEEVIEDRLCYRIRVTYPDRPRSADYQYADVWITEDERAMLKGRLHIGDRSIPMRHHFLVDLLKTTHLKIAAEEGRAAPLDPRWSEHEAGLQAFEGDSPAGGSHTSYLEAPFPTRIEEPTYIVELMDWGI